jgi:hypothetical protein
MVRSIEKAKWEYELAPDDDRLSVTGAPVIVKKFEEGRAYVYRGTYLSVPVFVITGPALGDKSFMRADGTTLAKRRANSKLLRRNIKYFENTGKVLRAAGGRVRK